MPLKLAVFDFDQTLSAAHVYFALAGGAGGLKVPPPYARTEVGQLARLLELDGLPEFASQGGFALAAFGGQGRAEQLRALLDDLQSAGVECLVCSKGFVGPLRRCLDQVGLLGYFTRIYANIGGTSPTDYDRSITPASLGSDARFLGNPGNSGWGSKKGVVSRCLHERGLQSSEAVFVDDTHSEIEGVMGTCSTLQVKPPAGMGLREFDLIRRLLAAAAPASPRGSAEEDGVPTPRAVSPGPTAAAAAVAAPRREPRPQASPQTRSFPQVACHGPAAASFSTNPAKDFQLRPEDARQGASTLPEPRGERDQQAARGGVRRGSAGLPRTGSAPPVSSADRLGGSPPAPPPPPPARLRPPGSAGEPAVASAAYGPRPEEPRPAAPGGAAEAGRPPQTPPRPKPRERRCLGRGGSPWTPHEGTVPEEGQQTLVCCWLQASGASAVPTPREDGRGPPAFAAACALQ